MNNKTLLVTALVTALSGITLATQAHQYDLLPIDYQQYLERNPEDYKVWAAFSATSQEFIANHGIDKFNEKRQELMQAFAQKIAQQGEINIKDSLKDALSENPETSTDNPELAEALHTQTPTTTTQE